MSLPKLADHVAKRKIGRPRRTTPTVDAARRLAPVREVSFVILGAPRTKKTSNQLGVNRKTGKTVVFPSKAWRAWKKGAELTPDPGPLPSVPYNCRAIFYREKRTGDACGYYQGVADLLQWADVLHDDRWIVSWDGSRLECDPAHPRVEITLTPLALPTPERP